MIERFRARGKTVPLGVDIGADRVSIVAADTSGDGFTIREPRTLDVARTRDGNLDLSIAETIRLMMAKLDSRERRCVLVAPVGDVIARLFRVPPKMRRREADRAATLEADALVDWPPAERLVALDPIPERPHEKLLSVARTSAIERLVAIARAGGLRPVAVDTAACAWRRALPDVDAVLDCSDDRASLEIFGDPIGATHVFAPRLVDERLAAHVRSALVDARRDGVGDVQRLAISATRYRFESLHEVLRDDGYRVDIVRLGETEAPAWALAYGLATWSVARRGLATQ